MILAPWVYLSRYQFTQYGAQVSLTHIPYLRSRQQPSPSPQTYPFPWHSTSVCPTDRWRQLTLRQDCSENIDESFITSGFYNNGHIQEKWTRSLKKWTFLVNANQILYNLTLSETSCRESYIRWVVGQLFIVTVGYGHLWLLLQTFKHMATRIIAYCLDVADLFYIELDIYYIGV